MLIAFYEAMHRVWRGAEAHIKELLVEISEIFFFGIIIAVGALQYIG